VDPEYDPDYPDVYKYLRRIEYVRYLPTPYRGQQLIRNETFHTVLKKVHLYNLARAVYQLLK